MLKIVRQIVLYRYRKKAIEIFTLSIEQKANTMLDSFPDYGNVTYWRIALTRNVRVILEIHSIQHENPLTEPLPARRLTGRLPARRVYRSERG